MIKPSQRIVLIGMKSSGKTTVGKILAYKLGRDFVDMDGEIERLHFAKTGQNLRFRDIFKQQGKDYFRKLETEALQALADRAEDSPLVLATGGGLPLAEENQALLSKMGTIVFLDVRQDVLLTRILHGGVPAFFPYPDDPRRSLAEILDARRPVYSALAHLTMECRAESATTIADKIISQLELPTS